MPARFMGRRARGCAVVFLTLLLSLSANTTVSAANGSVTYTYDALGRVTSANYDTGVIIIYTYDANGNRTQQIINVNNSTGIWDTSKWDQVLWGT
jgi:YD repeat-containing protein